MARKAMRRTATLATLLVLLGGLGALLWRESARGSSLPADEQPPLAASESTSAELVEASSSLVPDPGVPGAPGARTELEAEAPASRSFFVHVITAVSYAHGATRVGNVAFRLYPQRPAEPARNGAWTAPIPLAPVDAPLYEGRTDANGTARVELALADFPDDGFPRLCARVIEPGFQQHVKLGKATREREKADEIQLMAVRGATARGRVVGAAGHGVQSQVRLCEWSVANGARELQPGSRASTLADGWFELHLVRSIEDGVLIAEAGAAGTASLTGVTLALEHPPTDLELVLRGGGLVRGRLVDRSGSPAAGVDMLVLLAELDDERGSFVPPEPLHSLRQIEGLGRTWATLVSARDGSFGVGGLRRESYSVRARTGQDHAGRYPILLTPSPVPADGSGLVLRLARPHIVVRLLDNEGRAWPQDDQRRARSHERRSECAPWPDRPVVRVFATHADDGGTLVATEALKGKVLQTGECICEVTEGTRCLVSVLGGGFDGAPREVDVPPGQDRVEVEFRARELGEPGAVAVRVFHQGSELQGRAAPFSVRLEHVASAVAVTNCTSTDSPSPYVLRAPAGTYRAVVEGETWTDHQHGYVLTPRAHGRAEAEVQLLPGLTQELALEIDAGASLEVRLEGASSEADVAGLGEALDWLDEDQERAEAARARLHLERPGHAPLPVEFETQVGPGAWAKGLTDAWPLGKTHLSARLPTGRHVLVGRLPGGREARVEVELRAGETTAVTLRF